ncbi:hypothetical protein I6F10_05025 [Pseudoalteromonas sp. SWYJZ98]|uniref:hypothetical protein n=1 Tax=Pseudoalteromonas sp. SWYJZ98 TaxID=2792060 RepID=UPI0018CF39DB|nr:hypothetical protein [Pseudoalteromonas sp. SWYJZ98]MBH0030275.1 hypothetical protein [Pseudoalteromonas sp. SWYJZ98]
MNNNKLKQIYEFLKSEQEKSTFLSKENLQEEIQKIQKIKEQILENNKKLNRFGYAEK